MDMSVNPCRLHVDTERNLSAELENIVVSNHIYIYTLIIIYGRD